MLRTKEVLEVWNCLGYAFWSVRLLIALEKNNLHDVQFKYFAI